MKKECIKRRTMRKKDSFLIWLNNTIFNLKYFLVSIRKSIAETVLEDRI